MSVVEAKPDQLLKVGKQVGGFLAALEDRSELLDQIGFALVQQVDERFKEGKGPDGESWKAAGRGGQTLVDSGRLVGSITHDVQGDSVLVGTNVEYAAIHQYGGTIKPKKKKVLAFTFKGSPVFARKVEMPARPFLGLNDESLSLIRGELADYVKRARAEGKRA